MSDPSDADLPAPEIVDRGPSDPKDIARIFQYFGEVETPRMGSAVYTAYSLGVAKDPELIELASHAMPDQPKPNVLYAAVHDLLLRDAEAGGEADALSRWYPSVSGARIPDASPWDEFRRFCLDRRDELEPLIANGRTQTCVVHRSAAILPALACVPSVAASDGRVGLLEIGPSAGLNLRLDQYRYDYHDADGVVASWGHADAVPRLRIESFGVPPPLPDVLEIVARRGLDLNPLDLSDPATIRWLRALIWPEHVERADAMDAALEVGSKVAVEIDRGDATREIEAHARALPRDAARVVFATHVFYQISKEGRQQVFEGLVRASNAMPIDLILMESSGEGDSLVTRTPFQNGKRRDSIGIARADSHGRSIAWRER